MLRYNVRISTVLLSTLYFIFSIIGFGVSATETDGKLTPLLPNISKGGKPKGASIPTKIIVFEPNPSALRKVSLPKKLSKDSATVKSSFILDYIPSGQRDRGNQRCSAFPQKARRVFEKATNIWSKLVGSDVPIVIRACWTPMENPYILGSCSSDNYYANFPGATKKNTAYVSSLSSALYGSDADPSAPDMHITLNSRFNWFLGLNGQTPSNQVDLLSVVLHEIAHGLNFGGGMAVQNGLGYKIFGVPVIYDTFIQKSSGKPITSFATASRELGSALTSNDLYFIGRNALAANGGEPVKIYAPKQWRQGSSYSHLDNYTFWFSPNTMMTSSISYGEWIHDPGPITLGLLKDLGWGKKFHTIIPAVGLLARQSTAPLPQPQPPTKPKFYWGAGNNVCCTSQTAPAATFSISAEGETRKSTLDNCDDTEYSWEGWVQSTTGSKQFTWVWSSDGCNDSSGDFSYTLENNKQHLFYAHINEENLEVWVKTNDMKSSPSGSPKQSQSDNGELVEHKLIASIPMDPNGVPLGKCMINDGAH